MPRHTHCARALCRVPRVRPRAPERAHDRPTVAGDAGRGRRALHVPVQGPRGQPGPPGRAGHCPGAEAQVESPRSASARSRPPPGPLPGTDPLLPFEPPPPAPHGEGGGTGQGERDEQREVTGQGRPRSPKTVQSAEGGEGKDKRERIVVGVRSPCQEHDPADAHPGPPKSVLESANPHMDSECASGCPWSTARATAPSPGRPTPRVVKQDKSSGGSLDTTKTRSGPQRVRMSSGERPIGAAKGKQPNTEPLCHPPKCLFRRCPVVLWAFGGGGGGSQWALHPPPHVTPTTPPLRLHGTLPALIPPPPGLAYPTSTTGGGGGRLLGSGT